MKEAASRYGELFGACNWLDSQSYIAFEFFKQSLTKMPRGKEGARVAS